MSPSTWSIIIAGIALVASVLSPVLTACFNNRHQRKMWEMQQREETRSEAINSYLAAAGMMLYQHTSEGVDLYGRAHGKVFAYVPRELWPLIIELDAKFHAYEYEAAVDIFIRISTALARASTGQEKQTVEAKEAA